MDLIDSLVHYVEDIKPYHTKIYGVDVEYRAYERINVSFSEQLNIQVFIGVPFGPNLSEFTWNYKDLDILKLDQAGELEYDAHFDISRGWDSTSYDVSGWDEDVIEHAITFRSKGYLMDLLYVNFTETLKIDIETITLDVEDCTPPVYNLWDPIHDGILILKIVDNTVKVHGNFSFLIDLPTIDIIDSTDNDGTYGIVSVIYDVTTHSTSILMSSILNDVNIADGKLKVGNWDSNTWDGNPIFMVDHPQADIYTRTQITEELSIFEGHGWDDSSVGGWDSGGWDDNTVWINHASSPIVYDVNDPCDMDDMNNNPIQILSGSPIGTVVFSAERAQENTVYVNNQ